MQIFFAKSEIIFCGGEISKTVLPKCYQKHHFCPTKNKTFSKEKARKHCVFAGFSVSQPSDSNRRPAHYE
jgi:hypothetical protein